MSLNKLPEVVKTEILDEEFFTLKKEMLRIEGQPDYPYFTLVAAPLSVIVLAQTSEGKLVLNWEYRHPVKKFLLSCPGGIKDENETVLECAQRELLEETGYSADHFEVIGEAYPFAGACNQKTAYVMASNAKKIAEHSQEPAEIIETILVSPKELRDLIKQKVPLDGFLLNTLFFKDLINI